MQTLNTEFYILFPTNPQTVKLRTPLTIYANQSIKNISKLKNNPQNLKYSTKPMRTRTHKILSLKPLKLVLGAQNPKIFL